MNNFMIFVSILFFLSLLWGLVIFYRLCHPVKHYDTCLATLNDRMKTLFKEVDMKNEHEDKRMKEERNRYGLNATLGVQGRKPFNVDVTSFPHLFIGGATNGGKTTLIYNLLNSMLLNTTDLKVVIFSPKRTDFEAYKEVKTRDIKVYSEPKEMIDVLGGVLEEIDKRDKTFQDARKYNRMIKGEIQSYNKHLPVGVSPMPYLFVLIDELSDVLGLKECRVALGDIARKGRYVGVHLCLATTQLHKVELGHSLSANLPARIAVRTADERGSEKILGNGKKGAASLDPNKGEAIFVLGWQKKPFNSKLITEEDIINVVNKLNEK